MSNFVDETNFCARAGNGGAGCVSFRREAHVPKGGPDGGDGGDGGSVWLEADPNCASLLAFRDHPHRIADSGAHGSGSRKHGKSGEDVVVSVPVGTVVKDFESGEIVCDLHGPGARFLAAQGGQGGQGNTRFLSNRCRAPGFAEQGEICEDTWYRLELKLLADVALVGFPSAGKSTLISVISAAKPKIADYPFTTLEPNLGVVKPSQGAEFVVADLPGLIEGAHQGRGMGHQFLRHTERARVLVYLLDLANVNDISPLEQHEALLNELTLYNPDLADRPSLVVGSKADVLTGGDWNENGLKLDHEISAVSNSGISQMVNEMAKLVTAARDTDTVDAPKYIVHRPEAAGVTVRRQDDGSWLVSGRPAERAVCFSDMSDPSAQAVMAKRLDEAGVEVELRRAGVSEGDEVTIGSFTFTYTRDL